MDPAFVCRIWRGRHDDAGERAGACLEFVCDIQCACLGAKRGRGLSAGENIGRRPFYAAFDR